MVSTSTHFYRSGTIESSHSIKILVTDINNKPLINSGNKNDLIYPRSSIKIFQAIPFIRSNAVNKYKLSSKNIALACSSHRGQLFHLKELKNWIIKLGISKNKLQCGVHSPLNKKASEMLYRSKKYPNQLHNNCAGKHLAMISSCLINNYDVDNYLDFNHPHQISIRKIFERFTKKKLEKKHFGIDGCSAPQYCFKIKDIGKMLTNLIKSYKGGFDFNHEVKILINSITANPNYIGGTDSLDSQLMKIGNKKIFCKGGAEGVFLFIDLKKNMAGVIKVIDGNERAIPYVIYNLFNKLKVFNKSQLKQFQKIYNSQITNHANIVIGSVKTNL